MECSRSQQRIFSPTDLLPYNGQDNPLIYISFLGSVYDVTSRPDLYGLSPPAPYHIFAGRECARALATMSMDVEDVGRTDIDELDKLNQKLAAHLTPEEVREAVCKAMRDWQEKFAGNYNHVGTLRPWLQGNIDVPPPPTALTGLRGMEAESAPALADDVDIEPGPLELLSRKPRLYLQRRFLGPRDCKRLVKMTLKKSAGSHFNKKVRGGLSAEDALWTSEESALLQSIEERLAMIMGGPIHPDETELVGTLTPGGGGGEEISEHLGLHVDTNAAPWRFSTAIIYLTSVPNGGETVFPAAVRDGLPSEEEEVAVDAARALLDCGIEHTDRAFEAAGEAATHAHELLNAASAGTGMRVAPEEGSVCIFWTRQDDGEIDKHSWHGGSPVPAGDAWKWTLQKFKEVPVSVRNDAGALADFCRSSRRVSDRCSL